MLDLPEGLDKVAGVGKAAFQPHLAGLEPGGAQQLGGFFHPELLDVLDGRDAQKLPEAAQTGAFAQSNAPGQLFHGQLLGVVLLYIAQHLFHPLRGNLFLLRYLHLAADALGNEQPQGGGKVVAHPVLVVERLVRHALPRLPQAEQHLPLPWHGLIQQKEGRRARLQKRADELLPEYGVHAADQPGLKHAGVQQRAVLGRLYRVQRTGVDEHALPGLQGQSGLVHVHMNGPQRRQNELKFLVPVPRHRKTGKILGIAGDGEQRAAVLGLLPPGGIGHHGSGAGQPHPAAGIRGTACLICHIHQFLSAIL